MVLSESEARRVGIPIPGATTTGRRRARPPRTDEQTTSPSPYRCGRCDAVFPTYRKLERHQDTDCTPGPCHAVYGPGP